MISESQIELWTSLFQARYGYVLGAARLYAPVEDQVDDIIQQVYLDFLAGALKGKWNLQQDIGPLLYQMAKRKAQFLWRKHRQERSRSIDALLQRRLESLTIPSDEDAKEIFERNEARILALRRCLEKLPSKSREIFEQHYFGGISMKEISEQQQKTKSTVHQFFFRIRQILRDCIKQSLPDSND